jgi:hypothetical protein
MTKFGSVFREHGFSEEIMNVVLNMVLQKNYVSKKMAVGKLLQLTKRSQVKLKNLYFHACSIQQIEQE